MAHVLAAGGGFLFAEVFGYFLHILLHAEKLPALSRGHMRHHLRDYGPRSALRTRAYVRSTRGRFGIRGIGFEWLAPLALTSGAIVGFASVLDVERGPLAAFMTAAVAWSLFMFAHMHEGMHVQRFWMADVPWFGRWFIAARRRHDIHHRELSDDGRMIRNYGICFFFMDRLCGTLSTRHPPFNEKGYAAARERYAFIFREDPRST